MSMKQALQKYKQEHIKNDEKPTKIPLGASQWRILPDPNGRDVVPVQSSGLHFVKDPSNTVKAVSVCNNKTYNEPCSICDAISEHYSAVLSSGHDKDSAQAKYVKNAYAGQRYLVNVVGVRTGKSKKTGKKVTVHNSQSEVLDLPSGVWNDIFSIAATYAEMYDENIFDLDEGRDVVITRTGSGKDSTSYTVNVAPTKSKVRNGKSTLSGAVLLENCVEAWSVPKATSVIGTINQLFSSISKVGAQNVTALPSANTPALSHGGATDAMDDFDDEIPFGDEDVLDVKDDDMDDIDDIEFEELGVEEDLEDVVAEEIDEDDIDELDLEELEIN